MASCEPLTDSISKEQVVLLCQLCESEPNLEWKCLECELMMCQKCTDRVHPRFANAKDHTIIDINDISKHQMEFEPKSKPDVTRMKCAVHSGQNFCLYCKTCKKLVCQTCIFKSHMMHEFDEISEEYTNRLEKIKSRQENVEKDIKTLTKSKEFLKQQTITRKAYYEQVKQNILEDERVLVAEVKNNTAKLFNELDLKWKSFSKIIDEKDNQLTEKLTISQEQHEEICHLFQHSNAKDVFTFYDSLLVSVNAKFSPQHLSFNEVAQFTCADKAKLVKILGKLEDGTTSYITDLQVEKQFETELKCVDRIASCSDDHLWICDLDSRMFQKVKLYGDNPIISERINLKMEVYDASLLPSNDLLLSVKGSYNLKLIPSGSTDLMDSVYTVSRLKQPVGVHMTREQRIIVGVRSDRMRDVKGLDYIKQKDCVFTVHCDDTFYPSKSDVKTKYSSNKSSNRNHLKQYAHTNYSRKSCIKFDIDYPRPSLLEIEYAFNISSNNQSMIAAVVSTSMSSSQSRVVILDKEGTLQTVYTGHTDVNKEDNLFYPKGITATPSDNFVVADTPNHTLHVLNSEGEFFTLFNTQKIGILLPCSLSFSSTGQLYIGCDTLKDCKEKAKIFKVDSFFY